jgi:hypothetical protein
MACVAPALARSQPHSNPFSMQRFGRETQTRSAEGPARSPARVICKPRVVHRSRAVLSPAGFAAGRCLPRQRAARRAREPNFYYVRHWRGTG